MGSLLGTGAYGQVRHAIDRSTGEAFAVKIIKAEGPKGKDIATTVRHEIAILRAIPPHANIMGLQDVFLHNRRTYFLVSELCQGGDVLSELLDGGAYAEDEAKHVLLGAVRGLEHIHRHGFVHRDLKLENILLPIKGNRTSVKIADFGLASPTTGRRLQSMTGSTLYIAPEILRCRRHASQFYDERVDVWSLGVCMYILLSGRPPFDHPNMEEHFRRVMMGDVTFPARDFVGVSTEAKQLVKKMLTVDPTSRITVVELLHDPWLEEAAFSSALADGQAVQLVKGSGSSSRSRGHRSRWVPPLWHPEARRAVPRGPRRQSAPESQAEGDAAAAHAPSAAPGMQRALAAAGLPPVTPSESPELEAGTGASGRRASSDSMAVGAERRRFRPAAPDTFQLVPEDGLSPRAVSRAAAGACPARAAARACGAPAPAPSQSPLSPLSRAASGSCPSDASEMSVRSGSQSPVGLGGAVGGGCLSRASSSSGTSWRASWRPGDSDDGARFSDGARSTDSSAAGPASATPYPSFDFGEPGGAPAAAPAAPAKEETWHPPHLGAVPVRSCGRGGVLGGRGRAAAGATSPFDGGSHSSRAGRPMPGSSFPGGSLEFSLSHEGGGGRGGGYRCDPDLSPLSRAGAASRRVLPGEEGGEGRVGDAGDGDLAWFDDSRSRLQQPPSPSVGGGAGAGPGAVPAGAKGWGAGFLASAAAREQGRAPPKRAPAKDSRGMSAEGRSRSCNMDEYTQSHRW